MHKNIFTLIFFFFLCSFFAKAESDNTIYFTHDIEQNILFEKVMPRSILNNVFHISSTPQNKTILLNFYLEIYSGRGYKCRGWIMILSILFLLIPVVIALVSNRLQKVKKRFENIIKKRSQEVYIQRKALENERDKSDSLLINILPVKIAAELKNKGFCKTEFYNSTSVVFTDFSNFTAIAEQLPPEILVSKLDMFFTRFDEICSRHKMEKIKTIGDSHMSVGGIPVRNRSHHIDAVLTAIEMQRFIRFTHEKNIENKVWKLRIGINSGELTAGVVGTKKFAFDVWGDTVNTASRFQEAGECGKINISERTAKAVESFFDLEYRGKRKIKHKGEVDMYFVTAIKKELSIDGKGEMPNMKFWEKYNTLVDLKYLNF